MTSLYFETFKDLRIQITTNLVLSNIVTVNGTQSSIQDPVVAQGYLTDFDDEFWYLGHKPGQIDQAVARVAVIYTAILPSERDELIDSVFELSPDDDSDTQN